ncbi:hypothetical protein QQS21_011302 [Conoideocrella luteorostrata]|uniref:Phospholipase/carboxylesterase/thioesterase domain-containing protein n=1 Tax=Conoideocrella luteorostrata TaxID=1105319 RepID=A0AAJ0CDH7_9HYPO|nr:hypothetical protein QQS21_011302 [Conoideocrella luteorostrata]
MSLTKVPIEPRQPGSPIFVVEPSAPHTHTILLLHGLGSNGEKFGSELLDMGVASSGHKLTELLPYVRFVFPTSRRRRSSAFGRSMLTQWFDIARLDEPSYRQECQLQGLAESATEIMAIIGDELRRVPPHNLIIGGLSQGCAMSLAVLLCLDGPVGGFIGMSGYFTYESSMNMVLEDDDDDDDDDDLGDFDPFSNSDKTHTDEKCVTAQVFERELLCLDAMDEPSAERTAYRTPVFLGHGGADEKVPVRLGEAAATVMRSAGYNVDWKCYQDQGHWYKIPDEIDDMIEFIARIGWKIELEGAGDKTAV